MDLMSACEGPAWTECGGDEEGESSIGLGLVVSHSNSSDEGEGVCCREGIRGPALSIS